MKLFKQIIGSAMLVLPAVALASTINVTPLSVVFGSKGRYQDIRVFNTGKSKAYVNIKLSKIVKPGSQHVSYKHFDEDPMKFGLVVSPNKMIIPAGQVRTVRLLRLLRGNKKEMVYQINVAPAVGVLERIKTGNKKVEAGVRVIVGYNVISRILPSHPTADLKFIRKGKTLTVINTGNSSALLYHGKQCSGEKCAVLPTKRIYAGLSWTTKLPSSGTIKYTENFLGRDRKIKA